MRKSIGMAIMLCLALALVACSESPASEADGAVADAAQNDGAQPDTAQSDGARADSAPADGPSADSAQTDTSVADGGADVTTPAGLLFSEDFDQRADWFSTPFSSCANAAAGCQGDVPAPWTLMYLDQPSVVSVGPTCEISSAGAIGSGGKGLRFVDDSRGRANAWKADCALMKDLGSVYPELYYRFDIVWNPQMTLGDFNAAKIFRAGYYLPGYFDGSLSTSVFTTADSTRGLVFIDIKREGSAPNDVAALKVVYRCNPGYKTDCRGFSQVPIGDWATAFADGKAHTIIFRMKNNSGTASDGVFQAWWDGTLVIDDQDVQWTTSGTNVGGFNSFSVGGNQDHNWGCGADFPDDQMCEDETQEWKHNIDNVKVGTTLSSVQ